MTPRPDSPNMRSFCCPVAQVHSKRERFLNNCLNRMLFFIWHRFFYSFVVETFFFLMTQISSHLLSQRCAHSRPLAFIFVRQIDVREISNTKSVCTYSPTKKFHSPLIYLICNYEIKCHKVRQCRQCHWCRRVLFLVFLSTFKSKTAIKWRRCGRTRTTPTQKWKKETKIRRHREQWQNK